MGSDAVWDDAAFGTLAVVRSGYAFKSSEWRETGVPVVKIANVKRGRLEMDGCSYVDPATAKASGFMLAEGDVLVGLTGYVGDCAVVRHEGPLVLNQRVGRIITHPGVDRRFVYCVLSDPEFRAAVERASHGSAQANVSPSAIESIPVRVPPLPEQRRIAHILGTLDDKIELNGRTNETLEAMARALFQSWFVDFDPVRAKAEGRPPTSMSAETAALFPSEFEDSELGPIPRGWLVGDLLGLCGHLGRGIGPSYLEEGGISVVNQKCVRNHLVDFSLARRHDVSKRPVDARKLQALDILVNSTGVGTLGRIAQLWSLPCEAIVDSHVTVVRASAHTDPYFLGMTLLHREAEVEALGEGSTGQTELSRIRLGAMRIVVPPENLQRAYGSMAMPLLTRLVAAVSESTHLAATRDVLLPILLSGDACAADGCVETDPTCA